MNFIRKHYNKLGYLVIMLSLFQGDSALKFVLWLAKFDKLLHG